MQSQTVPVRLKAGWTQFSWRAYCVGYPPFKMGIVIRAKDEVLWKLKTSAIPQN
jgi:hypothetical protein